MLEQYPLQQSTPYSNVAPSMHNFPEATGPAFQSLPQEPLNPHSPVAYHFVTGFDQYNPLLLDDGDVGTHSYW